MTIPMIDSSHTGSGVCACARVHVCMDISVHIRVTEGANESLCVLVVPTLILCIRSSDEWFCCGVRCQWSKRGRCTNVTSDRSQQETRNIHI